jgi:hypothetical protein
VPSATPETTPPAVTLAINELLLDHAPPASALLNAVVLPIHTFNEPVIAAGNEFTVAIAVMIQLVGSLYVIVVLPTATPVINPVLAFIVAVAGVLLLHVPPDVASVNTVVADGQIASVPPIAAGIGLTVAVFVLIHPVGSV